MPFTVVVAPDSFKGTLHARAVAEAIAEGWLSVRPDDRLVIAPQADGGEGTIDAIEAAVPAAVRHAVGRVTGPDGRATPGEWLELPGGAAVVELAQSSGLPLMGALDAMGATSRGVGEVIRHALDSGARSLVIALGGSASTDGGAGALAALGLVCRDSAGRLLPDGGGALARLATVDSSALLLPPPDGVTLLTDVSAPLTGASGAAAVFGPQKGATPPQVAELDVNLARWAECLGRATGRGNPLAAGAGAAGGTAYGFAAGWGAHLESGAKYLARLSGLDDLIAGADLVLTGEGRFDDQSLGGKIVGHVLARADAAGVRSAVIAGQLAAHADEWAVSLVGLAGSVAAAMADPAFWLSTAGARAARELGS